MAKLEKIEGIGPDYARKLGNLGIKTTEALREHLRKAERKSKRRAE